VATTLSIVNMKGGVGKTTLTLHLAYDLASRYSKRVLVIDCDPQANATQGLLKVEQYRTHRETKITVSDLFSETRSTLSPVAAAATFSTPEFANLICRARSFTPGHIDLVPADIDLTKPLERARGANLEHKLDDVLDAKKKSYDYILIDCCPTFSILTINALMASDAVLVPVKPDAYAARGIPLLFKKIDEFNKGVPEEDRVRVLGIVFTMVDESVPLVVSVKSEILRQHGDVFQTGMTFSRCYPRATMTSETIFEIGRVRKNCKENMQKVTDEFLRKVAGAP
jgi:chromosome partitioning protein